MADVLSSQSKGVPYRVSGIEEMMRFDYPEEKAPNHPPPGVGVNLFFAHVGVCTAWVP